MFNLIRNIKYLRFVYGTCKKYNLKLKVFGREKGYYNFDNKLVFANIMCKEFFVIFCHEVGHHLDFKYNLKKKNYSSNPSYSNKKYKRQNTFTMEVAASKIAVKILDAAGELNKGNVDFLLRSYSTYTQGLNRHNPEYGAFVADYAYLGYKDIGLTASRLLD